MGLINTVFVALFLIFLFIFIGQAYSKSPILNAPSDWIKNINIEVYDDMIVIYIKNASISVYEDTGSMLPALDKGSNGIRIVPGSAEDIHIGDIVSYEAGWTDGLIVHRIVSTGLDSLGRYYILKGDNNIKNDPEKVRFEQIRYVTVAVIY